MNRYQSVRESITASFRRVAEAGRLNPGVDPGRAAVATIALMDGLQVQWLLDPGSTDMAEALAEAFRSMVSGYDLAGLEQVLDARSAAAASIDDVEATAAALPSAGDAAEGDEA